MKKKLIILISLLSIFYSSLLAQPLEWNIQQDQYTKIKTAIPLEDGKWLLAGTYYHSSSLHDDAYFRMVDSSGTIWGIPSVPAAGGISESTEILKKAGSSIFELGKNGKNYTVQKYLLDDNKLYKTHAFYYDEDFTIYDLDILPNGNVIVVGTKIINSKNHVFLAAYSNDLETNLIFWVSNVGQVNDVEVLDDGTFLIIGEFEHNGSYGIRRYSDNFGDYGVSASGKTFKKVNKKINGKYFAYQNDNLYHLNNNYTTTNSIDLSSYGTIIDMESDSTSTFVLCQGESTAPNILEFNNDFELVDSFSYGSKFLRLNDLILTKNEIAFAGYAIPTVPLVDEDKIHPSLSGYFKSFSRPFDPIFQAHDLEVSDVRIPYYEKNNDCTHGYSQSFVNIDIKKVSVDIVNHGEDTISNGYIFLQIEGLFSCYMGGFTGNSKSYLKKERFFNLNLAPNDTATIDILNFEFPKQLDHSYHIDLCAWVSAVDRKLDTNNKNDFFCGKIRLAGIDYSESEEIIGVYPNPAKDFLNISMELTYLEKTEIEIYTLLGQLVYKNTIPISANTKYINISNFKKGNYFVKIKNSKFEKTLQFAKQK